MSKAGQGAGMIGESGDWGKLDSAFLKGAAAALELQPIVGKMVSSGLLGFSTKTRHLCFST